MDFLWPVIIGIVPSIGVGYLFYRIMRAILHGDRQERLAYAQWSAEQDRQAAAESLTAEKDAASTSPH